MMAADGVSLHAVFRAPFVGHVASDLPQFRKELVSHAFFQNFHGPAFERLRRKPNRSVNQLHVFMAELLEEFIKFREGLSHHVGIAVRVFGVVDFLDR